MATATTTSNTETKKMKLKLMIDKKANKVLFAEAEKDFVDVLFNLLYMPFGSVTRLLRDAGTVSCSGNLFQSLENMSEAHLIPNQNMDDLLKPLLKWEKVSVLLQPQACPRPVAEQKKLYTCQNNHRYVTNKIHTQCPVCADTMYDELLQLNMDPESEYGIVKKSVTYMVTDDLSVTSGSIISGINLLKGIIEFEDIGVLEDRVVDIGLDEVLELLKATMQTNTVLTTVFLMKDDEAVLTPKVSSSYYRLLHSGSIDCTEE